MALKDLSAVTSAKFGIAGMRALAKYSQLTGAYIDDQHYMKEEGTARPASTFAIVRSSDNKTVASGVSGSTLIAVGGITLYRPISAPIYTASSSGMDQKTKLMIGGGAVVLLLVVVLISRGPAGQPRGRGQGRRDRSYAGGYGYGGYKKKNKKRK